MHKETKAITKTHWVFIHPFQLRLQRGIEVYLWNLASTLVRQGIQVDIITWDGPLEIPDYALVPGISLLKVPEVHYFQAAFAIPFYVTWLWMKKYEHVFVHFAGYGEGMALKLVNLFQRAPFSVVFHFPLSQVPHRYREFERWNFQRNAQHLIAVSQATCSEVEQWAGRSCSIIGHGVNTQLFQPNSTLRKQIRQELDLSQNVPVLISVAALEERKGMQWVIQAMPVILENIPDIHYIIVGEGPYRNTLISIVANLHLEARVHFVGVQLEVLPYLCAADIVMILSRGEASSISLLEALACELPAVTSSCPPFNELIREAWGILIDETDLQQVASAVLYLVNNPASRISMGGAGRNRMIEGHAWPNIAKEYKDLIK